MFETAVLHTTESLQSLHQCVDIDPAKKRNSIVYEFKEDVTEFSSASASI
jgi:hypothetical protein